MNRLVPALAAAAALALGLAEPALSRANARPALAQDKPAGPAAGRGASKGSAQKPGGKGDKPKEEPAPAPLPPPPEPDLTVADRYFGICDYNRDGWVSYREASQALDLDKVRFSAYDKSPRDGRITKEEFRAVYSETVRSLGSFRPPLPDPALGIPPEVVAPEPEPEPVAKPMTVIELFGAAEPRPNQEEIVPRPPLIRGPVPVFRRLDLDGNGAISEEDLKELLRPLQVTVRPRAVIASIDTNGDGVVDEGELRASMRGGKRALPAR